MVSVLKKSVGRHNSHGKVKMVINVSIQAEEAALELGLFCKRISQKRGHSMNNPYTTLFVPGTCMSRGAGELIRVNWPISSDGVVLRNSSIFSASNLCCSGLKHKWMLEPNMPTGVGRVLSEKTGSYALDTVILAIYFLTFITWSSCSTSLFLIVGKMMENAIWH